MSTRYAWNSTRTNYFTQSCGKPGTYVSACGTLRAIRSNRPGEFPYLVTDRYGVTVGYADSFAALGEFLDDITSTINPNR